MTDLTPHRLILAPPGCGKTEALAVRAVELLGAPELGPWGRVLGVTYSKKARDNLRSRIKPRLSVPNRNRVAVYNLHGLAARLLAAHGEVVGLTVESQFPDDANLRRIQRACAPDYKERELTLEVIRQAKDGPYDDEEVLERIEAAGLPHATALEHAYRHEHRLDYNDLLRLASRLLLRDDVRATYQAHFRATLVDEVQDLSMLQYNLASAVSGGSLTFAGDPGQGIYTFAGAQPERVFEQIHQLNPDVTSLQVSYRSSPAVLRAVNAIAVLQNVPALTANDPYAWPPHARVLTLESEDWTAEGRSIVDRLEALIAGHPSTSVGVLARTGSRLAVIKQFLDEREIDYHDWTMPVHDARVLLLLRRHLDGLPEDPEQAIVELTRRCCAGINAVEVSFHGEVITACDSLRDHVSAEVGVVDAIAMCRTGSPSDSPTPPGIHLLSGHAGKGQEFDVAVVVGLEEDCVPHYLNLDGSKLIEELRVLHVMVSRARRSLVVTRARSKPTRYGPRPTTASRWWSALADVADGPLQG